MKTARTILIIDDDARNIFALSLLLKTRGYTCLSASDARKGLLLLNTNPDIAVVLLDMMMPDMDGYEALAEIRAQENFAKLPVVAVTAQAMPGDREKCLAAGATAYLAKPVDVDRISALLETYFAR
ncbi:MAG: response regulator [Mucilaginibacter polytrichastri]|nr:response regulator [Mucilaginibacter polytrichastri]